MTADADSAASVSTWYEMKQLLQYWDHQQLALAESMHRQLMTSADISHYYLAYRCNRHLQTELEQKQNTGR